MQITPKTEEEIKKEMPKKILDAGFYSFEVRKAEEKTSSNGNPMIELNVSIFPNEPDQRVVWVFDYLMEKLAYKLRHFCRETGLIQKYNSGMLSAEDCVGKGGVCKVGIQRDRNGVYDDRNIILDYGNKEPVSSQNHPEKIREQKIADQNKDQNISKDDIPF